MNVLRTTALMGLAVLGFIGCAHNSLSQGELHRVQRPAFMARTLKLPGPRSQVFQDDGTYKPKLKTLDAKEADRRLTKKLARGMNRWEVSERLRASTAALLPKTSPWTEAVDPADVGRVMQTLLVEEETGEEPDYQLLSPTGADTVVEMVIEEYGMRSAGGRAGVYVKGYGRMFKLRGGGQMWHRSFSVDQVSDGTASLDPFATSKAPELFRNQMSDVIDAVAEQFARDLSPRTGEGPPPPARKDLPAPGQSAPADGVQDEELPDPGA